MSNKNEDADVCPDPLHSESSAHLRLTGHLAGHSPMWGMGDRTTRGGLRRRAGRYGSISGLREE